MTGSDEVEDEEKLAAELKGNTLRVYLYVLKSAGNVGVREVQRALGFSSPTLAVYHLDKLAELGLMEKRLRGVLLAPYWIFMIPIVTVMMFYPSAFSAYGTSSPPKPTIPSENSGTHGTPATLIRKAGLNYKNGQTPS